MPNTRREPRRFSIRLPRQPWLGVAVIGLVAAFVGWHFGLKIFRVPVAIGGIEQAGNASDEDASFGIDDQTVADLPLSELMALMHCQCSVQGPGKMYHAADVPFWGW